MATIKGIPYEPILTPEYRIQLFLEDMAEKKQRGYIDQMNGTYSSGFDFAVALSKVWFKDEIQIMELAGQKQATEV